MSKYKANNTMKLLGYQSWVDGRAREQIEDVSNAYKNDSDVISLAVDIFNLGLINGIRRERIRK